MITCYPYKVYRSLNILLDIQNPFRRDVKGGGAAETLEGGCRSPHVPRPRNDSRGLKLFTVCNYRFTVFDFARWRPFSKSEPSTAANVFEGRENGLDCSD